MTIQNDLTRLHASKASDDADADSGGQAGLAWARDDATYTELRGQALFYEEGLSRHGYEPRLPDEYDTGDDFEFATELR